MLAERPDVANPNAVPAVLRPAITLLVSRCAQSRRFATLVLVDVAPKLSDQARMWAWKYLSSYLNSVEFMIGPLFWWQEP